MRDIVAALFEIPEDAPHLEQALTHPSFTNEARHAPDNQRLEFLGDAVLGLCTSQLLFERYPEADEGTLTRLRAQLVNTERLAEWGRAQGVAEAIRLGRGALSSGLRESNNVVADAVEACIAAAYLDGGLAAARAACARIVGPMLEQLDQNGTRDPKSDLQEYVQSRGLGLPVYEVCDSGGPAHDRWFEVRVGIAGQWLANGRGRSKRLAERAAAEELLRHCTELLGANAHLRDTKPDDEFLAGEDERDTLACIVPAEDTQSVDSIRHSSVGDGNCSLSDMAVERDAPKGK
jgi:ribonuclease III